MDLPDDELTAEERARFAALPRERAPDAFMEERIVAALRREGALRAPWYRKHVPVPIAAAAGFLLFTLGAAAGRGARSPDGRPEPSEPSADVRVIESPRDGRLVTWM
jgi:hypothetical protein